MKVSTFTTYQKILCIAFFLCVAFLPTYGNAQTPPASNLEVVFQSTPLFEEVNFIPGDSVSRFVRVINNTSEEKQIFIEAINVFDPDDFSTAFTLTIQEQSTNIFNGTLAEFFDGGEISLSTLSGNGTATEYTLTAEFIPTSGNEYQEKNLGFDILIGFEGSGGSDDVQTSVSGGGGSGSSATKGLTIYNEKSWETVSEVPNADEVSMNIEWDTNYESTSRVVYGTVSGVFDYTNPPNYGYPFSTVLTDTPAIPNGVTHHVVTIQDIIPGTTYYYRVVSTASPPTIGYERSFLVQAQKNEKRYEVQGFQQNANSSYSLASSGEEGGSLEDVPPSTASSSTIVSESLDDSEEISNTNVASLISSGFVGKWWWIFSILILTCFYIWYIKRRESD